MDDVAVAGVVISLSLWAIVVVVLVVLWPGDDREPDERDARVRDIWWDE